MKTLFNGIKLNQLSKKIQYSCCYSFYGGLGNQMFQYAFALAHQKSVSAKGFADLSHYHDCLNHNGWEIEDIFELPDKLPTICEITSKKFRKLCKKLELRTNEGNEAYHKASSFSSPKGHWSGYWQSYKYFSNAESLIRTNFIFKNSNELDSHPFLQEIQESQSVSLHIRRGDYISSVNSEHFGGICTEAYYSKAIELIEIQVPNAQSFVFSDDKEWCRSQFNDAKFTIVEGFSGKDSWKDMLFMSRCKHSIIANSSFSWWGMFLGDPANRIVVGSNKFLHESLMLTKIQDFLPDTAFRISGEGTIEHTPSSK